MHFNPLYSTFSDFFRLFLTQPANTSNPKSKKQPKPSCSKISSKPVNKAKTTKLRQRHEKNTKPYRQKRTS